MIYLLGYTPTTVDKYMTTGVKYPRPDDTEFWDRFGLHYLNWWEIRGNKKRLHGCWAVDVDDPMQFEQFGNFETITSNVAYHDEGGNNPLSVVVLDWHWYANEWEQS